MDCQKVKTGQPVNSGKNLVNRGQLPILRYIWQVVPLQEP